MAMFRRSPPTLVLLLKDLSDFRPAIFLGSSPQRIAQRARFNSTSDENHSLRTVPAAVTTSEAFASRGTARKIKVPCASMVVRNRCSKGVPRTIGSITFK